MTAPRARPTAITWAGLTVLALLAVVPIWTEWADALFYRDLATRLIILAIAAVSLNLILGFGGMVSFGHAAFLGIGAYAVGIPAYYEEYSAYLQFPLAIGLSALFALVTGAISLRTRGVNFIMITMAFAQMVFFAFVSIEEYGGDDGLVIDVRSEFSGLFDIEDHVIFYYVCFAVLVASIYLVHRITRSRFGMVIEGAKLNERRMRAVGYPIYRYKLVCYVISGALCGLAGALLGNYEFFVSPSNIEWTKSGELIFMVVAGGTGHLFGPLFGVVSFLLIEEGLSRITIYWQILFGGLLVAFVLFAPGGIAGMLQRGERNS